MAKLYGNIASSALMTFDKSFGTGTYAMIDSFLLDAKIGRCESAYNRHWR